MFFDKNGEISKNVNFSATTKEIVANALVRQPLMDRIVRIAEVMRMTGYKRASLYGKTDPNNRQYDPDFPKRVHLSSNGRGAVGWIESEILIWLDLRRKNRCVDASKSGRA